MSIEIQAFATSDDVLVVWRSKQPIPDCIGFELNRFRNSGAAEIVENRVTFTKNDVDASRTAPSSQSPIRRYSWTDHVPNSGETVSYTVTPVIQRNDDPPKPDTQQTSPRSKSVALSGKIDNSFECYFNRGMVISQFMSSMLDGNLSDANLKEFKTNLNTTQENKVRDFLGGDLRKMLISILAQLKNDGGEIYLAMFELSDEAMISGLKALGGRAHILLPNGAHKSRDDDENKDARQALKDADCDVQDRMLASGSLGHNKFGVIVRDGKPVTALTGSTNWSPTGLCTQINNLILINDRGVAQVFRDQWDRLKGAGDAFPASLVNENSKAKGVDLPGNSGGIDVWFTRTHNQVEMDAAVELIKKAKEGIVFLMFQPGGSPMLDAIMEMQAGDSDVFVKGVVSTASPDDLDKLAHVTMVDRKGTHVQDFRVVQPTGLHQVGNFAAEVMRGQFLKDIGFAIVHSKLIVIDPGGDDAIVITGSHNFSATASAKNDENMVIIKGNAALAHAYAVNVQGVFDHYRFRAVAGKMQKEGKDVIDVMKDPKSWQKSWFNGDNARELDFWLGK